MQQIFHTTQYGTKIKDYTFEVTTTQMQVSQLDTDENSLLLIELDGCLQVVSVTNIHSDSDGVMISIDAEREGPLGIHTSPDALVTVVTVVNKV